MKHQSLWQKQQEEDEHGLPPFLLMADAIDDSQLCLHRCSHAMLRATIAYSRASQPDEMMEDEDQEESCCYIATNRPRVANLSEINLQRSNQEDESAISKDDGNLRTSKFRTSQQFLEDWPQHALVVHSCRKFVPSTKQTDEQQREEDAGRSSVKGKCKEDEADEEQDLDEMQHLFEVSHSPHPRTHEGLQHPRNEEKGRQKCCDGWSQLELEQHQQGYISDDCCR